MKQKGNKQQNNQKDTQNKCDKLGNEPIVLDGHKLCFHQDRIKDWLAGKRIAPITIDMALTRSCNYKCVYCYGMLQENKRQVLTKKILFDFLDDAAEIGVKAISLVSDGESMCSPHFYDFITYAKKKGLDIAVGTNGSILKKEKLKDMLSALTYLRFNMSAGEPKRYARIMGCKEEDFHRVCETVRECVRLKKENKFGVTIGLQMVLMPDFKDQVIPLTKLGKELGVDYLVIKHCSDDENSSIGIDYSKYDEMIGLLKEAESYSTDKYLVKAKWSKILSGGKRKYTQCYGPPFIIQLSGSGLVAPCGMLFADKYRKFHIGNIAEKRFKDIWKSDRYWEVMDLIASDKFNAQTDCGTLCLQHKVNEFLWDIKKGNTSLDRCPKSKPPMHINYI